MPLYFFHFTDGTNSFPDRMGVQLADIGAARKYARRVAAELADDREQYKDFYVRVVSEEGEELARAYVIERH